MTLRTLCAKTALSRGASFCKLRNLFGRKLCIVLSLLTILHFSTYYFLNVKTNLLTNPNSHGIKYIKFDDQNSTITPNKQTPKILYWKSFDNITGIAECVKTCPYKCDVTDDLSQIETADAVLLQLMNLWSENWVIGTKKNIPFPTYRRPDQVWVMFNFEPPPNLFGDLHIFDGLFNWTTGYRKDSTLFQPYGFYRTLNESEAKMAELEFKNRNFYKEKTNNISCMISNCKDTGQRYRTVDKLSKYINIDKYGKCYKKECGDYRKPETCESVIKTYKFYLGLENSRCKDYVTEKYWYSMLREQIPIVNWDFDHIDESIPIQGSFISISDFKSLQELAKYIENVNNNETLYNSYFNWKKKYMIDFHCGACTVCEALHKPIKPQVIEDFAGWMSDDVCDKVDNFNILKVKLNEYLFWKLGI